MLKGSGVRTSGSRVPRVGREAVAVRLAGFGVFLGRRVGTETVLQILI